MFIAKPKSLLHAAPPVSVTYCPTTMPDGLRMPWESSDDYHYEPQGRRSQSPSPTHRSDRLQQQQQQQQQQPQQQQPQHGSENRNQLPSEAFAQEMLAAHNKYRAMHQVPPLRLDMNLSMGAQYWAQVIASRERLEPDTESRADHLGENLAMKYDSSRTNFSGSEFTDYWYTGISEYNFSDSSPKVKRGSGALSFTQIVWKSSRQVGFGRAVSRSGKVYAVARYYPPGNSINEFAENVFPAGQAENRASPPQSAAKTSDHSTSVSHLNEYTTPTTSIGAMKPTDKLLGVNKSTSYENDKTVVTVEEKYMTQDGTVYTKERKTTFYGREHK